MMRIRPLILTVLLAGATLASAVLAGEPAVFPTFKGKDLLGKPVSTDSFRGKPHLILVGFEKEHGKIITEWSAAFKQAFPDEKKADLFAIVALEGSYVPFRGMINKSMAKGKPEPVKRRIMAVYAADSVCKKLEIEDRSEVHVYVLDAEGRIVYQDAGKPDPAPVERMRTAIEEALSLNSARLPTR